MTAGDGGDDAGSAAPRPAKSRCGCVVVGARSEGLDPAGVIAGLIALALLCTIAMGLLHIGALAGILAFAMAVWPVARTLGGVTGADLVPVLGATGRVMLAYGVFAGVGMALAPQPPWGG